MHNVLAIMGSPRKGDTYHLTQKIEATMSGLGEVEFDYLWLRDADLRICRGCYGCLERGEWHCPLDDDRAEIEQRMLDADGVIFASPVYALSMTALMKNLLDRLAYTMHRPRFFEQKALIVVSAGAAGIKETQEAIAAVRYMGFDMSGGRVGLEMLPRPWTQAEQRKMHVETQRAARVFHDALDRQRRSSPTFMETAYFRIQQAMFEVNRENQPADYEYFAERGWLDRSRRWYVNVPVNPFYDLAARMLGRLVRRRVERRQHALEEQAERREE
ncbi:MAG: flavodoxin family protein [Armatimonadia bacterium]|nr:flavodoxin family protein [Armatimonadia bacterium]